ncbi:SecY-interacting protein [Algibacillus agarilyticus]|uniref:SecY-interacting protein n=1 Tax=Algibacillus agarilyticus TaxID=2234133 RepID=UPI000DCFBE95|nr:SecY-interacting protein [Algibacillus agarilyticus]
MSEAVKENLEKFTQQYMRQFKTLHGTLPLIEHDPHFSSPCEVEKVNAEGLIHWQPVAKPHNAKFADFKSALNIDLHPSIIAFYSTQYCNNIPATYEENWLELLQPWSEDDDQNLQQNLLAHAMMKQKLKQPLTFFIAVTDDDSLMISILNETGEVVLEPVGKPHSKVLANNLADFIAKLDPIVI